MNDFVSNARLVFAGRGRWVFVCLAAVGLAAIAYAHRVHVVAWLPYLMLLACPLMHLFMFHGHGGGHEREGERDVPKLPAPDRRESRDA